MKRLLSASGAIGYILISGFVITLLLLAFIEIGQERVEDGVRTEMYAVMPSS